MPPSIAPASLKPWMTTFNSAQAVAVLFDLAREINRARERGQSVAAAQAELSTLSGVLGLTLPETANTLSDAAPFIELLIQVRSRAPQPQGVRPSGWDTQRAHRARRDAGRFAARHHLAVASGSRKWGATVA